MRVKTGMLIGLGLLLASVRVEACALLMEENASVKVAAESAVIVWDEKNKTQHFIRRAQFNGSAKSLGFVVPTPSVPKLAKAKDAVYGHLENLIKPKIIHETVPRYRLRSIFTRVSHTFNAAGISMMDSPAASVEVIDTQRVGDYDATILRATDAAALGRWLAKNGYSSDAAFEKWLDIYIRKRWYVTAFKVAKNESGRPGFALAPVRMSFTTPRPFYPYREPQQGNEIGSQKRSLRVFFFALNQVQAVPGTFKASQQWPGKVQWADSADKHGIDWASMTQDLNLPQKTLREAGRLTVFEDFSSLRPGTDDVFFTSTANTPILPAPIVVYTKVEKPIFIELLILVGGATVGSVLGVRKLKQAL